jgi:hypothetical protein
VLKGTAIRNGKAEILLPRGVQAENNCSNVIIIKWTSGAGSMDLAIVNLGAQSAICSVTRDSVAGSADFEAPRVVFTTADDNRFMPALSGNELRFEIPGETGAIFHYESSAAESKEPSKN